MALTIAPASEAASGALLVVDGLTVRYGERVALDGVELTVQPGEVVALAGENGAGKSTLVRCIAGEMPGQAGHVRVGGRPVSAGRSGVAVVWQDLCLCDNLDIAGNLLLGQESRRWVFAPTRLHARAGALLAELGIPLLDTYQPVQHLSGGQRQLLAVARALRDRPEILVLDEPTATLGVAETHQVEEIIGRLRRLGTTILFVSHDVEQIFRLADRVVVLRRGRVVGTVATTTSHPDEVTALITGQEIDASARRQLDRLHGLVDRLASADPKSSVSLILSALSTALGGGRLALHLLDGDELRAEVTLGLPPPLLRAWARLPLGPAGGPTGLAAASGRVVVEPDLRTDRRGAPWLRAAAPSVGSVWAVPIQGARGIVGVISVLPPLGGEPRRDQLDLVSLYAGHAAGAIEREQLLEQVTARNRVLESIRDVLQNLAGPAGAAGLDAALHALREGLQAVEVGLVVRPAEATEPAWRASVHADPAATTPSAVLLDAGLRAATSPRDGRARRLPAAGAASSLAAAFPSPAGDALLVASWRAVVPADATALLEDAANSLRLALEREEAQRAQQEAVALRRSQELQRQFLSRLSHELRTPLTAIRGYASSLLQPDVTWDEDSQQRFLGRIAKESARLDRLVGDLLDFSAIESSVLRLHPDWCDLALVIDAALAVVAVPEGTTVGVTCNPDVPPVWADHDRVEQVLVNLVHNAVHHNPPGTRVHVGAAAADGQVDVTVEDDGVGVPADLLVAPVGTPRERRSPTAGAGLGLSIARGIIAAHGGRLTMECLHPGTRFVVRLPAERPTSPAPGADEARVA